MITKDLLWLTINGIRSSPAAVGISPVIESGVMAISPSDTMVALGAICKVSLMKVVVSNKSVVMMPQSATHRLMIKEGKIIDASI